MDKDNSTNGEESAVKESPGADNPSANEATTTTTPPKTKRERPPPVDDPEDPELEAILNDALLDFGKPPPQPKIKPRPQPPQGGQNFFQIPTSAAAFGHGGIPTAGFPGGLDDMNQVWTEEFIKEATTQFEKKMREYLQNPQGASSGQNPMPENLNKIVENATKAAVGNVVEPAAVTSQINEALKNFNPQESLLGDTGGINEDELAKLMNSFAMGGGGSGDADEAEMDELLPFMTNFMQKLLSKDLLYPVLSDIVDRYPEWLADNRQKLSNDEFDKYNRQYEFMKKICEEYASEADSDSAEIKRKRFDKISELMLKVQLCGPPPKDLVGEEGGFGIPGMDSAAGMAGFPGGDQCSIV